MLWLLLYLCILIDPAKLQESACEEGWLPLEETHSCYRILFDVENTNFEYAQQRCEFFDSNLASIHSKTELQFINDITTQNHTAEHEFNWVLVGARKNNSTGEWTWNDGTPFDFKPWQTNFPKNLDQECAVIVTDVIDRWITFIPQRGDMIEQPCTNRWYRFLCKKPSRSRNPKSYERKCIAGWHYSRKLKACYREFLFYERVYEEDAKAHCNKFDSALTSIRNEDELQFLLKLCFQNRPQVWRDMPMIGINQTTKSEFIWLEGGDVATWIPWAAGEPTNSFVGNGGNLACDAYGDAYPNHGGRIIDNNNSPNGINLHSLRFICKKKLPEPGCDSCILDQVAYGDVCAFLGETSDGCKTLELDCSSNDYNLKFNNGLASAAQLPSNMANVVLKCNNKGDFTLPGSEIPIETASCQVKKM